MRLEHGPFQEVASGVLPVMDVSPGRPPAPGKKKAEVCHCQNREWTS